MKRTEKTVDVGVEFSKHWAAVQNRREANEAERHRKAFAKRQAK